MSLLEQLREPDLRAQWCGPDGLLNRAADEIIRLQAELAALRKRHIDALGDGIEVKIEDAFDKRAEAHVAEQHVAAGTIDIGEDQLDAAENSDPRPPCWESSCPTCWQRDTCKPWIAANVDVKSRPGPCHSCGMQPPRCVAHAVHDDVCVASRKGYYKKDDAAKVYVPGAGEHLIRNAAGKQGIDFTKQQQQAHQATVTGNTIHAQEHTCDFDEDGVCRVDGCREVKPPADRALGTCPVSVCPIWCEHYDTCRHEDGPNTPKCARAREADGVTLSAHGKPMDEFSTALHRFADSIPGVPQDHDVSHDCIATRLREVFRVAQAMGEPTDDSK